MSRDELSKAIGDHILKCFDEWMGKPVGQRVVIPIEVPRETSSKEFKFVYPRFGSSWSMNISCDAPMICKVTGPGPGQYEFIKPSEFFKNVEELGW
jgi:hypothetical protein